jgi:hypothetical protein
MERTYEQNLALIAARIAKKKANSEPVVLPGDLMIASTAAYVQLPIWHETIRGIPNSVLRSALFGAIRRGARKSQFRVKKTSVEGITIIYTGFQLDQADLDVWLQCLHLVRIGGLGTRIQFTASGFLKAIGRGVGKSQHDWLKDSFARLFGSVEIVHGTKSYSGPLLHHGARDDTTGHYVIEMNPAITSLFGSDGWTGIELEARQALKKQQLAQWLHGFYSSHARPFPMRVETIHKLCGSETKQMMHFRADMKDALTKVADVTGWTWMIDSDDLVHVEKTPTASQQRHLIAKHGKNLIKKLSTKAV